MSRSNTPPPVPPTQDRIAEDQDADLVAVVDRHLARDPAAWLELWTKLTPLIAAIARSPQWTGRLCRSWDDCQAIVVRVMGRLAARDGEVLRRFRTQEGQGAPFRKWIATVAANASRSHVRAHPEYLGRRASNHGAYWVDLVEMSPEDEMPDPTDHDPSRMIDAHRLAERLGPRFAPEQREALGLWLDGGEYEEIATEMHLPDETVSKRKVRSALKRMRVQLAAEVRALERADGEPGEER
jgi:DNA-directed RNA polymerase specialized sigma24 family protein